MKTCKRCQRDLPHYAFSKDKSRPDGFFPWCGECKSQARRDAYIEKHPNCRAKRLEALAASEMIYKDKLCIDCLEMKPVSQFHRKRSAADKRCSYCIPCASVRSVQWERKNKERAQSRRLAWRQSSPRQSVNVSLNGALKRCPTENPATLDQLMDIWNSQGGKCAVSGIAMTWAQGKVLPTSITLDRINPDGRYTIDNLRLICHAVNSFRGRMSDDEMYQMALAIVANMKRPKLRIVA